MTGDLLLVLGAAAASAVETVEAVTIVLALGVTRGWRAPLLGAVAAVAVLAALVAVLGPALDAVPIDALRLVVGSLLLVFGLQWLRKAILRAAGSRRSTTRTGSTSARRSRRAPRAHRPRVSTATRSRLVQVVMLEGLEIVFIVLTLGASHGSTRLAAAGALVAVLAVVAVAAAVRHPLSRVPENQLAFAVGVMLTSFGIFWSAEGAGVDWPGSDAALAALIAVTAAWSLVFVVLLRRRREPVAA